MNNPIKWEDVNTSNYFKMGNRHVKKFSSLIKEMKRLPIRIAKNQNPKRQQVLERMWRKENPLALLVGMQTGATTLEKSMEVPQKVKNRTTL